MEVLFPGHPAGVQQPHARAQAKARGQCRIAVDGTEAFGIHTAREKPHLGWIEALVDQFPAGFQRRHIDQIHLVVIPDDELPGQLLHGLVAGENLNILGQSRVVGAVNRQAQGPGDAQGGQTDGAGRGRMDVGVVAGVDEVEHFQERRIKQLLVRVDFEIVDADGTEILHARLEHPLAVVAGNDGQAFAGADGQFGLLAQGTGHAVDLVEGIGEMGHPQGVRHTVLPEHRPSGLGAELAVLGEDGIGHEIGRQDGVERPGRTHGAEDIEDIGPADMVEQGLGEMRHDPVGRPVDEGKPTVFEILAVEHPSRGEFHERAVRTDERLAFQADQVLERRIAGRPAPGQPPHQARAQLEPKPHLRLLARLQKPVDDAQGHVLVQKPVDAKAVLIILISDAVEGAGHGPGRGRGAQGPRSPIFHAVQKFVQGVGAVHQGVGGRDIKRAVVVGAANQVLAPGLGIAGIDIVELGQSPDVLLAQTRDHRAQTVVLPGIPGAVDLEIAKQQQQLLEIGHRDAVVDPKERVGHGMVQLFLT